MSVRSWRAPLPLVFALVTLAPALAVQAVESGPQGIIRQFCQADALGRRANVAGWNQVAPVVEWTLEPAWDKVVLIAGYTVGSPRSADATGVLTVDVHYSVVGQLTARGLDDESSVETVTYRVHAPTDDGWRIIGPPPPPHIFGALVNVPEMQRSLDTGATNFIPNTAFVWRLYRSVGWRIDRQQTMDLLSSGVYRAVADPAPGDLVAYLRNEQLYHVGILEAQDQVVSSTLNQGIVRATIDAFAGPVKYLRLVDPSPPPLPAKRESIVIAQPPSHRSAFQGAASQTRPTPRMRPAAAPTPKPETAGAAESPSAAPRRAQPARPKRGR